MSKEMDGDRGSVHSDRLVQTLQRNAHHLNCIMGGELYTRDLLFMQVFYSERGTKKPVVKRGMFSAGWAADFLHLKRELLHTMQLISPENCS